MSGTATTRLLLAYMAQAQPTLFLSGLFATPEKNFYNSEEVQVDIVRSGEDVAIAVQDLSAGYRKNSTDLYTNKAFKPPVYKESIAINSYDLMKRMPGESPFDNPEFRGNVVTEMFSGMQKVERKIRRAIELQAAQVLQTGAVTLRDETGAAIYELDYKSKASHLPAAGTSWATATGAQMISDINALAETIRDDGIEEPNQIIMGSKAYEAFLAQEHVQKLLDNRRIDVGNISRMEMRGQGGAYRGTIDIGNYRYDLWTYNGRYVDPETKQTKSYLDPGKVIVRASDGRLDATFGAIPNIGKILGVQSQLIPEMPSRFNSSENGIDLFANLWLSNDGEQLWGGVGARPLMIPTAIDTYGCLNTQL